MAQRRYHVQLNVFEGGMLVASFLLASVLIFVFGMYIGKEVQAQKIADQAQPLRVPVVLSKNQLLSRPPAMASLPAARRTAPPISDPRPKRRETLAAVPKELSERTRAERLPEQLPKQLPEMKAKLPALSPSPPSPLRRKAPRRVEKHREEPAVTVAAVPAAPVPHKSPQELAQKLAKKQDTTPTQWSVQVQATTQEKAAQQAARRLRKLGYTPMLSKIHRQGQVLYRVRVGPFSTEADATAAIARFRRDQTFAQAYLVSQ